MINLETILKDTLWVAKMVGYRFVGTYEEADAVAKSGELRDFDIVCTDSQPEHLRDFYKKYEEYFCNNGWITVQDYYNEVYSMGM